MNDKEIEREISLLKQELQKLTTIQMKMESFERHINELRGNSKDRDALVHDIATNMGVLATDSKNISEKVDQIIKNMEEKYVTRKELDYELKPFKDNTYILRGLMGLIVIAVITGIVRLVVPS